MYIESLKLKNFRNYETLELKFNKGINIIYGKNAQGKTNLLESIYVLGITKSHRSSIDNYLIRNGENYLNIHGIIKKNRFPMHLEYSLSNIKELKIDKKKIGKVSDYISKMNIIIFYPEDLEIIKGSPSIRRKFLNLELSQLYSSYYTLLNDYNRLLKMRNDYLKKISSDNKYDENYLNILNDYFLEKGILICKMRNKFIKLLNEKSSEIFKTITGLEGFHIIYNSNIDISFDSKEKIKKESEMKMKKMFKSELKFRASLVGPHRDDFMVFINEIDTKSYGSQGQQRTAALSLKLSEIELVKEELNDTPILLLDDVLSELDKHRQNYLLDSIDNIQTIITCTGLDEFVNHRFSINKIFHIKNGHAVNAN